MRKNDSGFSRRAIYRDKFDDPVERAKPRIDGVNSRMPVTSTLLLDHLQVMGTVPIVLAAC